MQVTSISLVHYLNNNQPYHIDSTDSVKKFSHRNGDFAPSYYKDFNINLNFNGRSPEDFYDQDFNKKNMPKTMSEYLYSDFSDRHHLPPVQLMNEAFDFLSVAATVDDIKELYPNEPLFNQLKPANYYAATRGVLRKIGEIKKECLNEGVKPESLFKDGSDDLTAYIVKKIFLEGKTVNEIDKDFENDLNGLYKGVIKSISSQTSKQLKDGESKYFSNSTTYSLGIRFPQISFWNSLINTRDDYEHVGRYKVNGRFVNTSESGFEPNELTKVLDVIDEKPVKKIKLNQHKVKQITDAIVDGNGDVKKIKHNIHKRAKGTQELSFVQRYWSEIMSVATEKVHLSEELSYFYAKLEKSNSLNLSVDKNDALEDFVNGDNLSDRETDLLKRFWNFHSNDDLKDNFSMAISSTIKEFSEAYNDNGYSEEFEIMIDYAHSLKPQRERAKLLHDEIQKEYEQLGEYLSSLDNDDLEIDLQETESPVKNIKMYHFDIGNGVIIPSDINIVELFEKDFKSDSALLPSQYLNAYLNDFKDYLKTDTEYNRFVVSAAFDPILIPNKYKQYLYSEDEVISITKEVSINGKKHSNNDVYASIAFWDYCIKHDIMSPDELLNADGNKKFFNLFKLASDIYKDKFYENPIEFQNAKNEIQKNFNNLQSGKLSNSDVKKVNEYIYNYLKNYDMSKSPFNSASGPKVIQLFSIMMNKNPKRVDIYQKIISKTKKPVDFLNRDALYIADPNGIPAIKNLLAERYIYDFFNTNSDFVSLMITSDPDMFNLLLKDYPAVKNALLTNARQAVSRYNETLPLHEQIKYFDDNGNHYKY